LLNEIDILLRYIEKVYVQVLLLNKIDTLLRYIEKVYHMQIGSYEWMCIPDSAIN